MGRRKRKQNKNAGNSKGSLDQSDSSSSGLLRKRVKLEQVDDVVSVCGGEKVTPKNPLLIELVLENVFSYFENSPSCMKKLRLVCKLWDRKIKETQRRKTEIDVIKLVSRYPRGLGWKTERSGENGEPGYTYQCPYPVEPDFENLKVSGDCKTLNGVRVISWFEKMGSNVKSLHFQSPLTCYHQTRFLECVLKRWCKNLSRLYLDGCIWDGLAIDKSRFNNDPFLMNQLKEIILNCVRNVRYSGTDCFRGIEGTYLNYAQIESNKDVDDINMKSSAESSSLWKNIISHVGVEKILIKTLPNENDICKTLFPIDVMPKEEVRLVKTLKHFEYQDFVMFKGVEDLTDFRDMQFPITKLCFGSFCTGLNGSSITSLLKSLSTTLQHLEFTGNFTIRTLGLHMINVEVRIPPLPYLKFFKNGDIQRVLVGSMDFVKNLPKLETCSLRSGCDNPGAPDTLGWMIESAFFKKGEEHNNLKKLELIGNIMEGTYLRQLGNYFPNLKTLVVMLDHEDGFFELMNLTHKLNLEEVRITSNNGGNFLNNTLISRLFNMPNLRFLEIVYITERPFNISLSTCVNVFAKAPKLTSLKLKNVSMFEDEREKIRKALSHISCVSFTDCVLQLRLRPTNFEYSIGTDVPAIDWSKVVK